MPRTYAAGLQTRWELHRKRDVSATAHRKSWSHNHQDCFGNLLRITVWDEAGTPFDFDREVHALGWAHHPESNQRNIQGGERYPLDVASLLLSPDEKHNQLYWPDVHKTSMIAFLKSLPAGKATYLFEVRVNADNARPRKVPVRLVFDPACSRLSFTPFDTRWPGWRWRRRALTRKRA
jgi:hypothetical protein